MPDVRDIEDKPRRPRHRRIRGLGYLPVWFLLIAYFVWLCTQMAGEAPGGFGGGSLVAILVAVLAGLAAGGMAMAARR